MSTRVPEPLKASEVMAVNRAATRLWRAEQAEAKALWGELFERLSEAAHAATVEDRETAVRALRRAADLEYDLTGDCAVTGELLDRVDPGGVEEQCEQSSKD